VKMIEMEFLVTRRLADDASTPAYHALMTVLRRPKARMANGDAEYCKPGPQLMAERILKDKLKNVHR